MNSQHPSSLSPRPIARRRPSGEILSALTGVSRRWFSNPMADLTGIRPVISPVIKSNSNTYRPATAAAKLPSGATATCELSSTYPSGARRTRSKRRSGSDQTRAAPSKPTVTTMRRALSVAAAVTPPSGVSVSTCADSGSGGSANAFPRTSRSPNAASTSRAVNSRAHGRS